LSLDLHSETNRLLGPARAERARLILSGLAGREEDVARPEQLSEILGAAYRQPARFLANLAFWKQRLGPHEPICSQVRDDGVFEVELRDAKGVACGRSALGSVWSRPIVSSSGPFGGLSHRVPR
jgi:hypothetical protein